MRRTNNAENRLIADKLPEELKMLLWPEIKRNGAYMCIVEWRAHAAYLSEEDRIERERWADEVELAAKSLGILF